MFEPTRTRIAVLSLGMTLLTPGVAGAEPCGAEIDRLQAEVDTRIDTTAGTGRTGNESSAATEHHQPTPGSIARAEGRIGEGSDYTQVLSALAQAREADQAGNAASCDQALAAARAALGR